MLNWAFWPVSPAMLENPSETTLCDHCENQFVPAVNHPPIPSMKLRSHLVPKQAEHAQMLAFIQAEEHEVERYEVELQRLRRLVEKLSFEQDVHKQRIQERKCWVSSALRVPKEVWCEIFTLACGPMAPLDISSKNMTAVPLGLSHVCFYWRDIVTALPKLWSAMKFELYPLSMGVKNIIELFLQNSASQLLEIELDFKSDYDPSRTALDKYLGPNGSSAFQALLSASSRFKVLEIEFSSKVLASFPENLRQVVTFPELEIFMFFCIAGDNQVDARTTWFWDKIKDASNLQHLTIPNDSLFRTSVVTPPIHIPTISIGAASFDWALSILLRCSQLTEFNWSGYWGDPWAPLARTPIVLPNLRQVHLSFVPADVVRQLFASVTLPAVTSISIGPLEDEGGSTAKWGSARPFVDMLERSGSPLQNLQLEFQDSHIPLNGLCRILRACANLTSLDVMVKKRRRATPDGFIHALLPLLTVTDGTTGAVLVPKLTHLRLHEISRTRKIPPQTQERLVHMAESRKLADESGSVRVSALEVLQISFSKEKFWIYRSNKHAIELDSGIADRFEELQHDGMKYSVEWITPKPLLGSTAAPATEEKSDEEPESGSESEDDDDEDEEGSEEDESESEQDDSDDVSGNANP
ncbi:hypothetical protein VNI00_009030 [Paramarasmius palmivorus]|uniref:F-box domain-containing protein n=1 Tax=Paramarasmius palmivorus TaxID=297713 RepID=A0AAW0CTS4_9AGAR